MFKEEYKNIFEYEDLYQISNLDNHSTEWASFGDNNN